MNLASVGNHQRGPKDKQQPRYQVRRELLYLVRYCRRGGSVVPLALMKREIRREVQGTYLNPPWLGSARQRAPYSAPYVHQRRTYGISERCRSYAQTAGWTGSPFTIPTIT